MRDQNPGNPVRQAFDRFGRDAGFEKHAGAWYRHGDEVIAVSHLQKSQYGPQYYWNQGFWLRRLGDERYPQIHKCHIRSRLEDLRPAAEDRIGHLLDLESDVPDEERTSALLALLKRDLLPLIERGSSLEGLRGMLRDSMLQGAAITGPAQFVLSGDSLA